MIFDNVQIIRHIIVFIINSWMKLGKNSFSYPKPPTNNERSISTVPWISCCHCVHISWRIQKVLSEGVQLWQLLCKLMEGERFQMPLKVGHHLWIIICLPRNCHLNEVSLADRYWPNIECCFGSFVNFQGFQTSIAMEPCSFVVFLGWVGSEPSPPLYPSHTTS